MRFALEQLFIDHNPDLVADGVIPFIKLIDPQGTLPRPVRFAVSTKRAKTHLLDIDVEWSESLLQNAYAPRVDFAAELARWRRSQTLHVERVTELAGYCLAMIAASCLLPGRRVENFNTPYSAPDLLFNKTVTLPLDGVEVAARNSAGMGTLLSVAYGKTKKQTGRRDTREGKDHQLRTSKIIGEVYLSLWGVGAPGVSLWEKVKP